MNRVKFDEREWLAKGFSRVTVELVRNLYTRTSSGAVTLNNDELETLLLSLPQPQAEIVALRQRIDALERQSPGRASLHALEARLIALERLGNAKATLHEIHARLDALERHLTQHTARLQALCQRLDATERMI